MKQKIFIKILFITSVMLLIPLFSDVLLMNTNRVDVERDVKLEKLQNSGVIHYPNNLWIKNPTFDGLGEPWDSNIEGDYRDVIGNIDQGQANFKILGDSGEIRIDEAFNDTDWTLYNNPDLPILPSELHNITESGCVVSHIWHEDINQTHNRPSVHWKRTINMPVDMTDYIITSASLEVIFNATVTVSPHDGGGIDREGDSGIDFYSTGDYAEFYVLLSDVEESFPPIRVAYNHTDDLGKDSLALSSYPDTPMNVVPDHVLRSILTSVLATNGYNFTITLGIDIYCEDNEWSVDIDQWDALIIRSFNLTFTYDKKIDQFTSIAWEQIGNTITGTNVQITNASLNFIYKIDKLWPTLSSPNSEIRVLINNNSVTETIKLSTATTYFQGAKEGGYDVTSLILKDVNITLSIQVFLADEFGLDQNITISIDDAFFIISYIEIFSDIFSEPWVFTALLVLASAITVGVGGYLIAYQRFLKYPRPVRKIRKFKRTLQKKKEPEVKIMPREIAFRRIYSREISGSIKFLKTKPLETTLPEKLGAEPVEPTMEPEELIEKSIEKKVELDKLVKDSAEEASKK